MTLPRRAAGGHQLAARSLKVTAALDPAEFATLARPPDGSPRVRLVLVIDGKKYAAEIAAKAVRKALALIAEEGPESCWVTLQGKLAGDEIADAGLSAGIKPAKAG